ncbi:MAG: hypothetical protein FDX18_00245 [Chlorobium sp.]|nr:MAG: hypothetical protein FDX18_00245 [Chlorobium sp.]
MFDDLIQEVQDAIECSRNWAVKGWPVTFGPRNTAVSSLKEAEALPRNFIFRQEAVNYWKQVRLTGNDAADSAVKAVQALQSGNAGAAENALYLCQYIEKPFAEYAGTWNPVYDALKTRLAGL